MRHSLAALALAFAVAGCDTRSKAMTGKEFFENFQKAEQAKEVGAVWDMLTEESRKNLTAAARAEIAPEDKSKPDDEKLGKERLARQLEAKPSVLKNAKFIEERSQAEQIILVVEIQGEGRKEIPLVREGGFLRVRWDDKTGL